jgi:hypothetical protein
MNNQPQSVAELLELESRESGRSESLKSSEGMRAVLEDLGPLVPPGVKSSLAGAAERFIPGMLNLPLGDVLAGGWNKLRTIFKYRDGEKYPPNEVYLVSLADPAITSTHHPTVQVTLDNQPILQLEFDLVLALTFDTAVLRIQNKRITEIQAGTCKGKGTLKYKKAILFERATREFSLRGSIPLGEGLLIG